MNSYRKRQTDKTLSQRTHNVQNVDAGLWNRYYLISFLKIHLTFVNIKYLANKMPKPPTKSRNT